jgi:hypothetical protein
MNWLTSIARWIPSWSGWASSLVASILVYAFLHEAARFSFKWWIRTCVIIFGLIGAAAGFSQWIKSGELQHNVSLLQHTVDVETLTIADVKKKAWIAEAEQAKQRAALHVAAEGIASASQEVAKLNVATAALSREAQAAVIESQRASARSKALVFDVRRNDQATKQRLNEALFIANEAVSNANKAVSDANKARSDALAAAEKAGVFHFAPLLAVQVTSALRAWPSEDTTIACAPGIESGCKDLSDMFAKANWRPRVFLGRSFWGSGVFDEQLPPDNAGIVIWYLPTHRVLAEELAHILGSSGIPTVVQESRSNLSGINIAISFIFVSR